MPNPFDGIGDFVGALVNGGQARETGFRSELNTVSSLDKKLAEAAMARDQARALAALDSGATGRLLGLGEEQSALAGDWSNVLRAGGGNAAVLSQALLRAHELGTRQNVQTLAMEPGSGYSPVSAQLVGLSNGPQQTSALDDNHLVLDRFSDSPAVIPTEIGKAMIEANRALATQRGAAADSSNARADLARRTDPNRPRGKDSGKPTAIGPRKVASKEEYDALPSGTRFIAPDGSERVKP